MKQLTIEQQKELSRYAQQAIDVQDACNLSGVVHAFSRLVSFLWTLDLGGTHVVNTHPLVQLFADKIASLSGMQGLTSATMDNFSNAYKWAHEQAAKGKADPTRTHTLPANAADGVPDGS